MPGVYFQPIAYTLPDGLQSVNGSSSTGGCQPESCVMMPIGCDCPGSTPVNGTLIDGVIPSIDTAQEGWASELFVVNRNGQDSFTIGFEFINEPFLRAVELTYFDCGVWGTGLTAVNIHSSPTFPTLTAIATELDLGTLSLSEDIDQNCASLRNIFIAVERPGLFSNYFIEFSLAGTSWRPLNWLHLAEIKFSDVASHSTPETTTTSGKTRRCAYLDAYNIGTALIKSTLPAEMRSSTTLPLVTTTTLPTTTMGAPSATNGDDNAITNATETPNSSRPFEVHSPAPTHNNEDPSTISTGQLVDCMGIFYDIIMIL